MILINKKMNVDQIFGIYKISRKLILHTSKHFYVFVPPNPILPGRKFLFYLFLYYDNFKISLFL